MPENRGCGGFGFGDDCCWIKILILLICCCCGGNRGGCCESVSYKQKTKGKWGWTHFAPFLIQ